MDVPMQSSVGAGDAFLGGDVLALARGVEAAEALAWGTAAGATIIACAGTARMRRSRWRGGIGNCAAVHFRGSLQNLRHPPFRGKRRVTVGQSQQRLGDIGGGGSRGHAAQFIRVGLQLGGRALR